MLDNHLDVHDPTGKPWSDNRHVECQDCHNGHAVLPDSGDIDPSGTLTDVAGIDINGSEIDPVNYEYQLCFRCHGDTQDQAVIYTSRLVARAERTLGLSICRIHPFILLQV